MRLLKNKFAGNLLASFKDIFEDMGSIQYLACDRGSEWVNKKMKDFCASKGIEIRHPYTSFHCPFVERVQLTLQVRLTKIIFALFQD